MGGCYAADAFPGNGPNFVGLIESGGLLRATGRGFSGFHATLKIEGGRMLKSIGLPELVIILVVAVLLFGGKKIPEVAKGLGEGIRNFKNSLKGDDHPDEKKQA